MNPTNVVLETSARPMLPWKEPRWFVSPSPTPNAGATCEVSSSAARHRETAFPAQNAHTTPTAITRRNISPTLRRRRGLTWLGVYIAGVMVMSSK